jgi:hypothetical protein
MRLLLGGLIGIFGATVLRGAWISLSAVRRDEELPRETPIVEPAFPDISDAP